MEKQVQETIKILKQGGIVIFPTDTAFGIGCRIDNEKAIEKLFKIRKRPETQAVPVLVSSLKMAEDYLLPISEEVVNKLIKKYWPGALTIVLPCKAEKVPDLVRSGGLTLGVRMPASKILLKIIEAVGVPILGPSANFHGEKTPYKVEDINPKLINLVDYVFPGKTSDDKISTVIDCSKKPWRVLREGAVKISNKQKSILIIDTASNQVIKVELRIDSNEYAIRQKMRLRKKAQVVLPMIEKILKKHDLRLEDLSGIEVNTGPGSFTGLRVGIAVANALSFILKVQINNLEKDGIVEPVYQ